MSVLHRPAYHRLMLLPAVLASSFSGSVAAPPQPVGNPSPDEAAIRAVLDAQVTAWNKADLDGFMAGYWKHDDLVFISGGDLSKGWKSARDRYVKRYQAEGKEKMGQLAFDELAFEPISPTAAIVHGRYVLIRGDRKDWGRFTLVFRKLADGWRITHDHTSVGPAEKKESEKKDEKK